MKPVRIGDFLHRVKDVVQIEDNVSYKRVTIKTKNQGVSLRDEVLGNEIGTKSQFRVKANQFILSKIDARWGAFGIVPESLEGAIATPDFPVFEFDTQMVSPIWLNFFTSTSKFIEICKAASRGVTNRQRLSEDFFLNYEILLPSKAEQNEIVARLQALQALHRKADAKLARLQADVKRLRQSILQEAIQGKLVDYRPAPGEKTGAELLADIRAEKERRARAAGKKPEAPLPPVTPEEMPFDLPEGWVWCRLGEVVECLNGYAFKSQWFTKSGIKLVRNVNVSPGGIDWRECAFISIEMAKKFKMFSLEEGDIVLSLDRPLISTGLKVAKITLNDLPSLLLQRVLKISPIYFSRDYLLTWLNSEMFKNSIDPGRSIGVPHLSHKDVVQIAFPLPPVKVQDLVTEGLDSYFSAINHFSDRFGVLQLKTERLWKSELQQAFKFESNG